MENARKNETNSNANKQADSKNKRVSDDTKNQKLSGKRAKTTVMDSQEVKKMVINLVWA
jgi:hypothetical protein